MLPLRVLQRLLQVVRRELLHHDHVHARDLFRVLLDVCHLPQEEGFRLLAHQRIVESPLQPVHVDLQVVVVLVLQVVVLAVA